MKNSGAVSPRTILSGLLRFLVLHSQRSPKQFHDALGDTVIDIPAAESETAWSGGGGKPTGCAWLGKRGVCEFQGVVFQGELRFTVSARGQFASVDSKGRFLWRGFGPA